MGCVSGNRQEHPNSQSQVPRYMERRAWGEHDLVQRRENLNDTRMSMYFAAPVMINNWYVRSEYGAAHTHKRKEEEEHGSSRK